MAKSATDEVIAINPETGKSSRMTRKAFDGVYKEKGFTLVTRENAEQATAAGTAGRSSRGQARASGGKQTADDDANDDDKGSAGGGAASIAKTLELDNEK